MFDYKPKKADLHGFDASPMGWLLTEFEAFEPNPKYSFSHRTMPSKDAWPIVVPKLAPPVGKLPDIMERVIASTWKHTEPSTGVSRGDVVIGTRKTNIKPDAQFHPMVRPTTPNIGTTHPTKSTIAGDWNLLTQLQRTNAVTFRGDTRPPADIFRAGGFNPPNTRQDRYYLENGVFYAFESYLKRRFQRDLKLDDFLRAVDSGGLNPADKKVLIDYMMWRKILEREAMHLGRMVENECLKGYISTARAIDTSIAFATGFHAKPGWLYLTIVQGGFIVPFGKKQHWGTEEAEIAQWGGIPKERIVGFVHTGKFAPEGPIFIRKSFRKNEPEAFKKMFNIMSGKVPKQV